MPDDERTEQEREATLKAIEAYAGLVTMAVPAVAEDRTATELGDAVDGLSESMAKLLLLTRVVSDAVRIHGEQVEAMGGKSPTLH